MPRPRYTAPTPSAAAELVAPDAAELAAGLRQLTRRLAEPLGRRTAEDRARLMRLFDRRLIRDIAGYVQARIQSLDAEVADRLLDDVDEVRRILFALGKVVRARANS